MIKHEDFWTMINSVKPKNFLIADPFSKMGNGDLGGKINDELFFQEFNIISHKTFLRLAMILDVVKDPNTNTMFITGFRGSGKTTFVNLLKNIVDNKLNLPPIKSVLEEELEDRDEEEKDRIKKQFKSSINQALNLLSFYSKPGNEPQKGNIHDYLKQNLHGSTIYINFEKETKDHNHPIEQVLNSRIKNDFKSLFNQKKQIEILCELKNYVKGVPSITDFESTTGLHFKKFIDFICKVEDDEDNITYTIWDTFLLKIDALLEDLNINQLLCIITLMNIAKFSKRLINQKQFYIFDNIDIIQENEKRVLEDFLTSYSVFVELMTQLVREIAENGIEIDFYRDMTFIFVMRETTTMFINDHFEDRLINFSKHFDVSSDIDKGAIIKKRKEFLEKYNSNISNQHLLKDVDYIYYASLDNYVREFIYSLFNNDYKRMISCIAEICQKDKNRLLIDEQINMLKEPCNKKIKDSIKHGSRSILLRLIIDHFRDRDYFKRIGVDQNISRSLKYTPSRVILTYLYGYQSDHDDQFMVSDEQHINLYEMYEELKPHFGDDEQKSLKIFVETLWGMFSLRTSDSWNHLITFDSVKTISKKAIELAILNQENVRIRITCAGRYYLRIICTHFEFFASRKRSYSYPLFSSTNNSYKDGKYQFELIIEDVYNKVVDCCNHLLVSEEDIYIRTGRYTRKNILENNCFYCKENKNAATHSERIIHNHIRYIDAYRLYLINGSFKHKKQEINELLIGYIKKYLELMKPCVNCDLKTCSECNDSAYKPSNTKGVVSGHFSDNNRQLYGELIACVKKIEETEYYDCFTEISRVSFKENGLENYMK